MTAPEMQAVQTPSLLHLIAIVDNTPLDFETNCAPYYRLHLSPDPRTHGYIHPDVVSRMPWPSSFVINHEHRHVTLSPCPSGTSLSAHANVAFQQAVDTAIEKSIFPSLNGMHSEYFRLMGAREFVRVERFASSLFGIATRGAHLTCYVRAAQGPPMIWVARRSAKLLAYPGLLDSTVAGGVKADHSPLDCILAESDEEAALPVDLVAEHVRSVGVITLANTNVRSHLHHSEVLYIYDLELPADVVPRPHDGEVDEFVLMSCDEVRRRMLNQEFKPNVCPVLIDFLVRHAVITPEHEPQYVDICSRLRRKLPVPTVSDE
ncbi:hypothetical protein E4U43_004427 [Claviceps pusilla]|uniref:Nudix hydrolase domain-containing protein n=1 Tax=Claviceps pusilla TaxID=123648 RepID=A0A9P7N5K2_9HYPO|nr:hypothetical protein E4U43_004427 [Claviceps pusilla]